MLLLGGTRAGCGVLGAPMEYVARIGTYPDYSGANAAVMGNVYVVERNGSMVTVQYELAGLEPNVTQGTDTPRAHRFSPALWSGGLFSF